MDAAAGVHRGGLGGAAASSLAARAQQPDRAVRRIGVLMSGDGNDYVSKPRVSAFWDVSKSGLR
jgi:hypothetical protein